MSPETLIDEMLDKYDWGFMTPDISREPESAYIVETDNGSSVVPESVVNVSMSPMDSETDNEFCLARIAPYVDGKPQSIKRVNGYLCRLSASGYMDRTDWEFCATLREVLDWLENEAESVELREEYLEPGDDDITTSNDRDFYQYGKLILSIGPDDDRNDALTAYMNKAKFWPNCWTISDHGNAHLIKF